MKKSRRLSKEAWLQQALESLAEDPAHLRIDELAARLGVSKGSFYWHFENREDFVTQLAEYWRDHYTLVIVGAVTAASAGSAVDRLRLLMKELLSRRVARFDMAIRSWARLEPGILRIVREVDEVRLGTLRGLFREMGFKGKELETRTRVFVVCHSFEDAFSIQHEPEDPLDEVSSRIAFFTQGAAKT